MPKILIEIDATGAAFEDEFEAEVSRVLADLALRLNPREYGPYNLHDANGNYCGRATVED